MNKSLRIGLAGLLLSLSFVADSKTDFLQTERAAMLQAIQADVRATGESTGISQLSPAVMHAMQNVERHRFVPPPWREYAYINEPLPIGHEQTISQPFIVALMTELARIDAGSVVLEIGTGSGYQAAVLAEIAAAVYTIEIIAPLANRASKTLQQLGYQNVEVKAGDGYHGWPERAPFDAILVTAAPETVPSALLQQLKPGGRMVIPVGAKTAIQSLRVIEKTGTGELREMDALPVRFVPFTRDESFN